MVGSREIGNVERLSRRARQTCDTLIQPWALVGGVTKLSRVHENECSRLLSLSARVVLPEPAALFGSRYEVGYGVSVDAEYLGYLPEGLLHPKTSGDPPSELAPFPDQSAGETGFRLLCQSRPRLTMPEVRQHPDQLVNLFRPARSARLAPVYRTGHFHDLLIWQRRFAALSGDLQQVCGEVLQTTGAVVQPTRYAGEGVVSRALKNRWATGPNAGCRSDASDLTSFASPLRLREDLREPRWGGGKG